MNLSGFRSECPENPDKTGRTDTRARIRNPDTCPSGFPSGFALSVSGLGSAQKIGSTAGQPVTVLGHACRMVERGEGYAVLLDGREIARADRRFLAVAKAAQALGEQSARAVQSGRVA